MLTFSFSVIILLVSADKSKKARSCCSCAASDRQTEATEMQCIPAGKVTG